MNAKLAMELGIGLEAKRVKGYGGEGKEGRIEREEVAKQPLFLDDGVLLVPRLPPHIFLSFLAVIGFEGAGEATGGGLKGVAAKGVGVQGGRGSVLGS
ncbi:hypothetical protein Scep_029678 [Stephania cephalantha]|uniref:Uncharacterized protein n=1 Tax=Stephania cephalantha TaxID=152367 RepID=A0AAP0E2Q0_9MAGN